MKLLSIVAAIAVTSSSAMAVEAVMGVKGRFDYVRTETETSPVASKTETGVLRTSFLRLVTDAKVNDTTSAKLTLDFQPVDSAAAARADSGVSELVYEAYLTKSLYGATVLLGKQPVMTGGRENDYSARDLYLASRFNEGLVFTLTGISAGYAMAGQNFYIQYLQQPVAAQAPLTDKKVLGAAYYGEFMDKMIMPIVSYHKYGTNRVGQYDTRMSAGLRVTVAQFMVEADYLMLEQENLTAGNDAELKSMIAHVRYAHDNFQPFVKYIKEDGEKGFAGLVAGATDSERSAWEVGIEYMPNKDEDMRLHLVYSDSESERNNAPASKVEETRIFAGMAFNYNILK